MSTGSYSSSSNSTNNALPKSDFTPREYQVEILEQAVNDNIIVHLPTGSGKTFIAVMLIKTYIHRMKRKYSDGGSRVYFLVNTTPLVKQQAEAVRILLPLQVGEYSGEMGVDYWDRDKWTEEQDKYQVLVMTVQIYLDMILHHYTNLKQACVLVFDECHHAVNNHPMKQVMTELDKITFECKPRILGLTATLLNSNVKLDKVQNEIEALEATFNARVVRAINDEMVSQYSTNPDERIIFYEEDHFSTEYSFPSIIGEFADKMISILHLIELQDSVKLPDVQPPNCECLNEFICKPIKRVERALKDTVKISNELGLFAADVCLLSMVILIERLKIVSSDTLFRIFCTVETGLHLLRKKLSLFNNEIDPCKTPLLHASNKVLKLAELLKNFSENDRAIIFVDRRSTAQALHQIFQALHEANGEYTNVKSEFIVGVNQVADNVSRENVLNRRKNNTIMKQFNTGEINVLFASNVIEEGVDIRACNLVIKFDMPITFRSYVQSKGRARKENSMYIIIAGKPKPNEQSVYDRYIKFQNVEQVLKTYLCDRRDIADNEALDDDDSNHEFFNSYGSKVTALSAISLINRYCAVLPQDKFSKLTPFWWVKEVIEGGVKKYVGYLKLPINASIKEVIEGIPRKTKVSAKRFVSLEVCKKLFEIGEFDPHFLPIGHKTELLNDDKIFSKWDDEYFNSDGNKNLRKNKCFFDKHYTSWECHCEPSSGSDVFMHIIKITPNYEYPDTNRLQAFYNLLLSDATFCILTSCPWPELPSFPLFMNVGEVKIEILQNYSVLQLTEDNIKQLKSFHKLLFTDALPLLKMYTVKNSKNCNIDEYILAPVIITNNFFSIDWTTVRDQGKFPEIKPKPFTKRLDDPVTEDRYLMKVVIPWYRSEDFNLKYVVTNVRDDQNPESQFPSQNFKSYADYFLNRYNQKIYDKTQPLLEVRAISSKINCLLPRSQSGSKKQKKDDDGFEETLVPELCYLVSFPSWYLLKVTLLPSALHRVHHLLLAEELRQNIAEQTLLGSIQLPHNKNWKKLEVDTQSNWEEVVPFGPDQLDILPVSQTRFQMNEEPLPWEDDEQEPVDIDRNLSVDFTALLHYNTFVNKSVQSVNLSRNGNNFEPRLPVNKIVPPLKIFKGSYPGYGPEIVDILTALTSSGSNDIINYERAELLGDSFLKFAASLALFTFYPNLDEGKLSLVKGKIIGNKNLFFCGRALNLPGFLKVNTFEYFDWKVPGFSLSPKLKPYMEDPSKCSSILGKLDLKESGQTCEEISDSLLTNILSDSELSHLSIGNSSKVKESMDCSDSSSDEEATGFRKVQNISCKNEYLMKHLIPEKVVSDSVEALLSVYVQNFGIEGGFKVLNWLSVLPDSMININMLLYSKPESPLISSDSDVAKLLPKLEDLESSLGYTFKDKAFLLQALSHSSVSHCMTDCYQRFEFLGDAILDLVLTAHIYEECKDMSPGELTDLRSALVNNVTFACIAVRHKFHMHMLIRACKLTDIISKFVKYQQARNHEIGYQVFYLIEEADVNVAESIEVPKVLGDVFESLIAAVYLDSGRDLNLVWRVVYNIMENEIKTFSKDIPRNPIRIMYEKFAAFPPKFGKSEPKGDSVMVPLEVIHGGKQKIFHGIGKNKNFAQLAAAKHAIRYFNI